MIIVSGFNVYPNEVEDALYRHPKISKVAVIGVPDDKTGEAVKAFVVLKDGRDGDAGGDRRVGARSRERADRRTGLPSRSSSASPFPRR